MTDTALTAIIGSVGSAIPATILAWAALRQGRSNGEKAQEINTKADQIHILTNAGMSEVKSALQVAQAKIEGLERQIAASTHDKQIADDLASGNKKAPQ